MNEPVRPTSNDDLDRLARYAPQVRFAPLGIQGQRRLNDACALICGCGALGTHTANLLVRAGVGRIRIVDRDFVEPSNLQRQTLFDEADAEAGAPKAVAAAIKLRAANNQVKIEPIVADLTSSNIARLADGVQVIVDGTDNFEARFLINDFAIISGTPWVYGGAVGAEGRMLTILPGETACLRCLMQEPPPPGGAATCESSGILGPAVAIIAALQAAEAIKILSGARQAVNRRLTIIDLWDNRLRQVDLTPLIEKRDCPACQRKEFPWLRGERGSQPAVLCGRNAVQLTPESRQTLDLPQIAARWTPLGQVASNAYLVRLTLEEQTMTLFADGRAIVSGTSDIALARSMYARFVGG